jgi:DNA invertase Pin-like site-specific DNA recombinase
MNAQQLIDRFGSVTATAKALGVTRQTIYNWMRTGITVMRRLDIEHKLGLIQRSQG